MCESEALGGKTTVKTVVPFYLFQGDDAKGPLSCDGERPLIRFWLIYIQT